MKRFPISVVFAWTVFAVAWFLPVIEGGKTLHDGMLPGWEAFRVALSGGDEGLWWERGLRTLTALSNGLVLASVFVFLRRPSARLHAWLAWSFLIATILDSTWAWSSEYVSALRVGYWLWVGSFAAMTFALFATRLRPRTVTAVFVAATIVAALFWFYRNNQARQYFVVRIVDEETGRGVPLVELKLQNDVKYWTDSAGVAAFDEPSLNGREVFLGIRSHGYEYPQEILFGRGAKIRIEPGKLRELRVRRTMIAERLYRLTGEGIYRDSVMAGLPIPVGEPLLNARVLGQDTVSAAVYRGKIFWIWGDTIGTAHWNFSVSAATSDLHDDPAVAVNYSYFTDAEGHTKQMLPLQGEGLVWIEGLIPMKDPQGEERLIATYTRQQGLQFPDECGLALFDDARELFKPWVPIPCTKAHVSSHPFLHDGYWYFYPSLRVLNDWNAIQDSSRWEKRDVQLPPNAKRPSCVVWNEYRRRWVALLEDTGDVYYAEAMQPEGPYTKAVKIIHHDRYNFYNVATHPFFNEEGGRVIYLEGTYTDSFSASTEKTPRYNYNQVMYRLRLDDQRLRGTQE